MIMAKCVKCQNSALMMCPRCLDPYCSVVCQAVDWYNHKKVCQPMPNLIPKDSIDAIFSGLEIKNEKETPKASIEKEMEKPICQNSTTMGNPIVDASVTPSMTPSQNCEESNTPLSKSSIVSYLHLFKPMPKKRYMLSELEKIPLKEGENLPLVVLDSSLLNQFVIVAYDNENKVARFEFNDNLKKLTEVCKIIGKDNAGYSPQINEICLAVFDDDGEWYRAVAVEVLDKGSKYKVQFIDYGNFADVSSDKIMPIIEELMFPTCANFCTIKNIKEADLPKVKNYLDKNLIIHCDVEYNKGKDIYEIVLHQCIGWRQKLLTR